MDIFERFSTESLQVLGYISQSSVSAKGEIPAGSAVNILRSRDANSKKIFKILKVTAGLRKKISIETWLTNAFYEAMLANSSKVEMYHLVLGFLHALDSEKYYEAKNVLPQLADISLDQHLAKFVEDFTELAKTKTDHYFHGRERELINLIVNLSGNDSKPSLLVGESGSGKTSLMLELAKRINQGKVPQQLLGSRILKIDTYRLVSSLAFENVQMSQIVFPQLFFRFMGTGNNPAEKTILFFDDLHLGTGILVGIDMNANKSYSYKMVAAVHDDFQDKLWDSPISRVWDIVQFLDQPDKEYFNILKTKASQKAEKQNVVYHEKALKKIIDIHSDAYGREALPGAGLKMMDALEIFVRHKTADYLNNSDWTQGDDSSNKEVMITEQDVIGFWDGGSSGDASFDSISDARILDIDSELKKEIIGQDEAIESLSRALRISSLKLKDENRAVGAFLLLGPTGVGKTETGKVLARALYGTKDGSIANFLRIDMTEFTEKHNVSRLFGAPPGYVGYDDGSTLTDFVADHPNCVLLFDEIDKAHPEVLNSLLHIMEEAEIRDNSGETISFTDAIILMTSNHGADLINRSKYGFKGSNQDYDDKTSDKPDTQEWKQDLKANLKKVLKPEFINRFDDVIVYNKLDSQSLLKIADINLEGIRKKLADRNINLSVTDAAKKALVKTANANEYGARDLRRVISREIIDEISKKLLQDGSKSIKGISVNAVRGRGKGLKIDYA